MSLSNHEVKAHFIEQLEQLLDEQRALTHKTALKTFIQHYFSMIGVDDLMGMELDSALGNALSMWRFIEKLPKSQSKVAVFNPTYQENGWHSHHTVIRLVQPDHPFIVDSIRLHLIENNFSLHLLQNNILPIRRNEQGVRIQDKTGSTQTDEAVVHIEIARIEDENVLQQLKQDITAILQEVSRVVADFKPTVAQIKKLIKEFKNTDSQVVDHSEILDFLHWLLKDNFIFLGFEILDADQQGQVKSAHNGLGLLRENTEYARCGLMHSNVTLSCEDTVVFCKAAMRSRVHRHAYPDVIALKRYDTEGNICGEVRIMGLYTSRVYYESPHRIPWLRRKVSSVVEQSQLGSGEHLHKELLQILESFPRDELFQISQQALFETSISILQIQERRRVNVFMRKGLGGLFVSALVYMPRDQYTTRLRKLMQEMLVQRLQALDSSFVTYFSESTLARVHFIFRTPGDIPIDIDQEQFNRELIQVITSWEEELKHVVLNAKGEAEGNHLLDTYSEAFTPGYKDMFNARTALVDIEYCEQMCETDPLNLSFYKDLQDVTKQIRFKVYHLGCPLPLSEQIPIFENLGLKVMGEHPYTIQKKNGQVIWIHDFSMEMTNVTSTIKTKTINTIFTEAFRKIWFGDAENDAFNRLVLSAQMNWQQVSVFRAYARYMRQVSLGFSQSYIADTLCSNIDIAQKLYQLFALRFNPDIKRTNEKNQQNQQVLVEDIAQGLDEISILSQDRVLRFYLKAICATTRTNFYQYDSKGEQKKYLSFKMNPSEIPDIPKPVPRFEIFVYSVRMEGVHLRGGKVARGGLRWSDRLEDFRTEVLGLVKAQHVKNAVIVPTGAKGGFVAKCLPHDDREAMLNEGISCYQMFIRGLLDITDNLQKSTVIKPERVVCYDEDDPYLVVAADKGTASFSDIANAIAEKSGFWLGDAFASGGSSGYDHKAMGITAKGAWVSVRRHFRECGVDIQKDAISVVGIGDMSGDVFGNGMLLSESIALVAAFNHLNIFIDPDPVDARMSFKERQRLFDMPRSSWQDYNAQLISAGGGVFSRSAKSITISPQMQARFDIKAFKMTPTELIRALLSAPVDLIWNGGIGTYVKASTETHAQVGDKANDNLRIDGQALRCKVFGEGGNLGMTQSGRIEYALGPVKGRVNTDFIDNAAGVDCSDHEVNIKILLNGKVASGDMTRKQRDHLLESMTDTVSQMVLTHNEKQTLCLSIAHQYGHRRIDQYSRFMRYLEDKGTLDRAIEYLPDNQTLSERTAHQQGLTRPELSTLISYAKLDIKEQLLESDVIDDPYIVHELYKAFPEQLEQQYAQDLLQHRLRREIIATQIANQLVDRMGICFTHQLHQSLGVSIAEVAKAFIMARDIFSTETYWQRIEQLDHTVNSQTQYEMIAEVMRLMRRACRWFCRLNCIELDAAHVVKKYQATVKRFARKIESTMAEQLNAEGSPQREYLEAQTVPSKLAAQISGIRFIFYVLPIHDAASETKQPLQTVADAFIKMGEYLDMYWFSKALTALEPTNHWEVMIKDSIRDELIYQQKYLAINLLACAGSTVVERFEAWKVNQKISVQRWQTLLAELRAHPHHDLAMFTVANKELGALAQRKH